MKYVPDTSVLVSGSILDLIKSGKLEGTPINILIPRVVLAEIEYLANQRKKIGFDGLRNLKELRLLAGIKIEMEMVGNRPTLEEIKLSPGGELDYIIREEANKELAVLITSDKIQASCAEAEGIEIIFVREEKKVPKYNIKSFFDNKTMSVHLKENLPPYAKKGTPGRWKLEKISEELLLFNDLKELAYDLIYNARSGKEGLIEIERKNATVVQLDDFRIVITESPFSDHLEITAVRPLFKTRLEDYNLSSRLIERFEKSAEGILIAGPPGSGKSTFASALAEFYKEKGKVVKTMEKPRDLQVSPEITQYTALEGDMEKTSDLLFLVRPDFTIYDEIRKTRDFEIYTDLRLSSVGMIGVIHSKTAVDAIQRFLSRLELGIIPQVIDTVIFIDSGYIKESDVITLNMTVKVPYGMSDSDLARPVVEIRSFDGSLLYEIYTFGEQIVVIPVKKPKSPEIKSIVKNLSSHIMNLCPGSQFEVFNSGANRYQIYLNRDDIPTIIGKKGKTVRDLEEKLGIKIDIIEMDGKKRKNKKRKSRRK
ncbi:MAG: ATPase [Candidatus Lokiarchaeota archaeon]|nr:ATPase [Candidatus Lokiarchaeota archaeon]